MRATSWQLFGLKNVLACLSLSGCVIPFDERWLHNPPLSRNVSKIIKGQTTKEDVIRLFGPPDIEADGPTAKASPNLPLFRMMQAAGPPKFRIEIEYPSVSPLPYSSIDDEHVALLYLEELTKGMVILPGPSWASALRNKLLIFIDKKKNVVDEFAYREEFKAE